MFYLLYLFVHVTKGISLEEGGWEYLNIYCRDNANAPVDWWYLYKPPMGNDPFLESGRNFSYITSDTDGKWKASERRITSNSMLLNTLAPIFKTTNLDNLAYAVYEERLGTASAPGSTGRGILIADEKGGVWIIHDIPIFPNLVRDLPTFPESEIANGHLAYCVSLNLKTVNEIAETLAKASPYFTSLHIPMLMESHVKSWTFLRLNANRFASERTGEPQVVNFTSRSKTLNTQLMVRTVGQHNDIIEDFACKHGVILDVNDRSDLGSVCHPSICGVRKFGAISLKFTETPVVYVHNQSDHTRFGVSTAANWQQRGSSDEQYWVCMSSLDRADASKRAGILHCVENYDIWLTFDNLKVKEPTC